MASVPRKEVSLFTSPLITQSQYTIRLRKHFDNRPRDVAARTYSREKCKPTPNEIDTFNTLRRLYDVRTCSVSRRATGLCTVDGWMCRWILPSLSLFEILDSAMLPTITYLFSLLSFVFYFDNFYNFLIRIDMYVLY